ncbi:tetratricopeptide repeat protein [Nodosilinea sp. E11]|uniref:tetratricopeptide repeat protein n=1 Tax=Nodosilinea sp. E11 TaxID=3037479 RepID=UPI002934D0E7|nr:tetratricopeptide repeat protein [Nodosilinea sp. E11]WOD38563.1 tetratricopeptide repeat protein [Nodosilinea sp. E11]
MHIHRQQQIQVCTLPAQAQGALSKASTISAIAPSTPIAESALLSTADHSLNRLAVAAVKEQQYSQALQLLNQLIERHPHQATHYSNRGLVYLHLDQPKAALADCDRAVALEPDLDQAYNNRAMCHATLGHLAAALDDYERAIDLNPFNSRARINLGATLRQTGDLNRALDCFDEALMFHQLPEFIYAERGRTYHVRGDWNCALADYRRALAAAASQSPSHQVQALGQRVQQWVAELLPQQSYT